MEFTINKENTEKLKELVKVSQSIADMTIMRNLYELVATSDCLKAIAYGNGNLVQFKVEISNFINEEDKGYFYIDILQFIQAIEKVFEASEKDEVTIKVKDSKLTVAKDNSKISVNMFDYLSEDEYIEAENAFEEKSDSLFGPTYNKSENTLKVTSELMSFSDTVGKFIVMMNRNNVSGFMVNKNKIYYSDQALSIIEKKLSYEASNKPLFVSVDLFNFLSSLSKVEDYDLEYTIDGQYVRLSIPTLQLDAILVLPEVIAVYPTEDEYSQIIAENSDKFTFKIDIKTLLSKVNTFDGVFPTAQWKWKTVDFSYDKSNPNTIKLYHSSDTAEVDTDLPIISSDATSTEESLSFKMTTLLLSDYISKFIDSSSDGTLTMEVSPKSVNEEHGVGVKITLADENGNPNLLLTLCKIFEEEVY